MDERAPEEAQPELIQFGGESAWVEVPYGVPLQLERITDGGDLKFTPPIYESSEFLDGELEGKWKETNEVLMAVWKGVVYMIPSCAGQEFDNGRARRNLEQMGMERMEEGPDAFMAWYRPGKDAFGQAWKAAIGRMNHVSGLIRARQTLDGMGDAKPEDRRALMTGRRKLDDKVRNPDQRAKRYKGIELVEEIPKGDIEAVGYHTDAFHRRMEEEGPIANPPA